MDMHPKQQGLRFPVKIYTEQLDKQCTHRFTAVKKSSVKRNSEQLDKQYKHRFTGINNTKVPVSNGYKPKTAHSVRFCSGRDASAPRMVKYLTEYRFK